MEQPSLTREPIVQFDAWHRLRQYTPARIALGRAGGSVPTGELLAFQLAHARARDAVHADFDPPALAREIEALGLSTLLVHSEAADGATYLKRPDLGRRLDSASRELLVAAARDSSWHTTQGETARAAVAIVVSDGLSAAAAQRQVVPLVKAWLPLIEEARWQLAPVVIVKRGRVAIEDEVGQLLGAGVAVMLLGERPGLGAPDSLGAYLVFNPQPGRTDADRNCVSNIRPEGFPPEAAALRLHYLVREALARQLSGIQLKDESQLWTNTEEIPHTRPLREDPQSPSPSGRGPG